MKPLFEMYEEKVPVWALPYIFNGDSDGLNDDEISMVDEWVKTNRLWIVTPIPYDSNGKRLEGTSDPNVHYPEYFSNCPAFGLPCNVVDCICMSRNKTA